MPASVGRGFQGGPAVAVRNTWIAAEPEQHSDGFRVRAARRVPERCTACLISRPEGQRRVLGTGGLSNDPQEPRRRRIMLAYSMEQRETVLVVGDPKFGSDLWLTQIGPLCEERLRPRLWHPSPLPRDATSGTNSGLFGLETHERRARLRLAAEPMQPGPGHESGERRRLAQLVRHSAAERPKCVLFKGWQEWPDGRAQGV
mmetsp:Transcript_21843/g.61009  ORF Transcript_21843/g.61009 Transcript_21843/m.61009 type:complete len:201 (-) Transcript_21843:1499-2101(-)